MQQTEQWMKIEEAIAQYGRQIINGCTVKQENGAIYIDVASNCHTIEKNVLQQAMSRVNRSKQHD